MCVHASHAVLILISCMPTRRRTEFCCSFQTYADRSFLRLLLRTLLRALPPSSSVEQEGGIREKGATNGRRRGRLRVLPHGLLPVHPSAIPPPMAFPHE
ncbi:protein of unknown function [Nitrospira japonica]|uniref:Uncharacterized protein n=1 Tax=Nitrospira japonica TaxID=1325564 RepID=A0A1W1I7A6_9BACT|nr:protein of unknown function [Nitrospira japonica]